MRSFTEWAERYNLPAVQASVTVSSWVWTGVLGAVIVLLAGEAPYVSRFFQLRTTPALAVLAIVCVTSIVGIVATRNASPTVKGVAAVLGNGLALWFAASLVSLSSERGAAAFASLPLLVAAYHGYLYRQGPRYPFVIVSIAIGFGAAFAMGGASHVPVFALITPVSIGVSLTLGAVALRSDDLKEQRERLGAAEAARAVEDKSREVQRLSTALLDVLGQNHDLGNSLAAARVNADWLFRQTDEGAATPTAGDLHAMSAELRESLERIARIFVESRRMAQDMGPAAAMHEVNVNAVVLRVAKIAETRFRRAPVVVAETPSNTHVLVRGGIPNLERILENLVLNAYEGDGRRTATEVTIRSKDAPVGFVTLEISDDGPGFSEEALARRVSAFGTTKPDGSGLGLYTAERLVVASGGQLIRANGAQGAIVRVTLAKGGMP